MPPTSHPVLVCLAASLMPGCALAGLGTGGTVEITEDRMTLIGPTVDGLVYRDGAR